MKVSLIGVGCEVLEPVAQEVGLQLVPVSSGQADVMVAYGGDGTLLGAERDFPSIPKMGIRRHANCHFCAKHRPEIMLRALAQEHLEPAAMPKLEAITDGLRILGLNDIILHNTFVSSGVRLLVWINGERYRPGEIVGDGLIAATPFGSTAYYRSITQSIIHTGIGLAFNNTTEPINHLVLREDEQILVRITRGPAIVTADNHPEPIPLTNGDEVRISLAPESANLLLAGSLRCPDCRRIRAAVNPILSSPHNPRAIASK